MTLPHLSLNEARRLFLDRHGLLCRPAGSGKGEDLAQVFDDLGFVQVDSINTVARAHDHILYARRPCYRAKYLPPLIERERRLFEAWTHDAAIVPVAFFPHWRHQFESARRSLSTTWDQRDGRAGFAAEFDTVLKRLSDEGPLTSKQLGDGASQNGGGWWDWKPTKTALEYLWRTGELAICHRRNFTKVYALTEHVIPPEWLNRRVDREEALDWSAMGALHRLGFGSASELSRFWEIFPKSELAEWSTRALSDGRIVQGVIDTTRGPQSVLFPANWEAILEQTPTRTDRVRILSPFDPALRDRKRAEKLFGFDYKIEVFVPEAKRKYGYYVFPVLEGTRMIGRIDLKLDRKARTLVIQGFWPEKGVRLGQGRCSQLWKELRRLARFAGADQLTALKCEKTDVLLNTQAFAKLM
ncbi:winged helix-turn-helix domain-containing protein [Shimia ponticola]|uniref:winged helix-turn-helix domain-containing protein n=1 Tax=Shimia ponticola TaxID=2582893 RepID=UPI0011BD533E|nr:crosslink repair DNA glycosylase YcaQ family protein [Shimia ponticola]